eukprot:Lithocolla_globosa_v1_NODE_580_length_3691_cov_16.982398.p3 type:complete len:180 gc:universal NODE_580_length_3691_cov_16.982398:561-22(-)
MMNRRGAENTDLARRFLRAVHHSNRSGDRVIAIFLDIVKAFDTVDHRALFVSLWRDGIHGRAWLLFQRWYNNLQASVRMGDGTLTDRFSLTFGTRQGGVLSPLFYLCFINGLLSKLKACGVGLRVLEECLPALLVVDDVVLLANSVEDARILLNVASTFSREWLVKFHVTEFGENKTIW